MIEIRPIIPADRQQWQILWEAYLCFYETTLPASVIDSSFARLTSGADHEFCGLLAIQQGQAIGLAHYVFHRHCWKIENVCYLQDLYVKAFPVYIGSLVRCLSLWSNAKSDAFCRNENWKRFHPQSRGTGAAAALIDAVYASADKAGAADVYWLTQNFNAAGRKLYDQKGRLTPFVRYHRG